MSDTDPRPGPLWFRENDGFLNTYVGIATWALALPAQVVLDRNKPEAFDSYFH